MELINENKIIKYLDLFKIFYLEDNNQNNQNEIVNKEIKNYFYFNGKGSGITLNLNKNSINPNTDYPTIQYGISFIMWIYIDIDLLTKYIIPCFCFKLYVTTYTLAWGQYGRL